MAVRKVQGLQKDMLVHMRTMWGGRVGSIDEQNVYKIRQIGPKQATIDRVNKETGEVGSWRGQKIRLNEKEYATQRNAESRNGNWRQFYPWEWSQVFVALGEAGWDPEVNF